MGSSYSELSNLDDNDLMLAQSEPGGILLVILVSIWINEVSLFVPREILALVALTALFHHEDNQFIGPQFTRIPSIG